MTLLVSWIGLSQAAWSETKTIRIRVPEGYDEITYDVSRISRHDLDHWLTLSPVLSQNTFYLFPENPQQCHSEDPAYVGCGREQVGLNRSNAKLNQEKIQARLKRLEVKQFPPDFATVVSYFHAVQSFGLWRNQQEIAYFETRKAESLERDYAPLGLHPKVSCAGVLQQIRTSLNPLSVWHSVVFDWDNCTWRQARKSLGEYPQQAWDTALKLEGIREHLVLEEN